MRTKLKKILALLAAATIVMSFGACGDKKDTNTESENTTASQDVDVNADADEDADAEEDAEEDVDSEEEATDSEDDTQEDEAVADEGSDETKANGSSKSTTKKNNGKASSKKSSSKSEKTTKKSASTSTKNNKKNTTKSSSDSKKSEDKASAKSASEMSTAEILKLYSTATEKAQNCKSLNKTRKTTSNSEIPAAYKSLVQKFLGIGDKNVYKNTSDDGSTYTAKDKDGKIRYCVTKSTLTANDIKSATITESGDNYIVTIKIKDGSSSSDKEGANAKNNSPIDKSGICTGERDIDIYDHKTAEICAKAAGGLVKSVKEETSNGLVKATINKNSGKLSKLVITFDISAEIDAGILGDINATGTTTVTSTNFKY